MAKLTHRQSRELFSLVLEYGSAKFHEGVDAFDPMLTGEDRRAARDAASAKSEAVWAKVTAWLDKHSAPPTLAELTEDIARTKAMCEGGE